MPSIGNQEWVTGPGDLFTLSIAFVDNRCSTWICTLDSEQKNEEALKQVDPNATFTHRHVASPAEARTLAEGLGCS
jgi:hypothetical protein